MMSPFSPSSEEYILMRNMFNDPIGKKDKFELFLKLYFVRVLFIVEMNIE